MKRVLVTPLDWGLGHATRCIPVIRELQSLHCEVVVAGSGASLELLKLEFPGLKCISIPGYHPQYASGKGMVRKIAFQLPRFMRVIAAEHKAIAALIKKEGIDLLISDNRYGCWSSDIPSVFITHQSNILMPKRFGWLQYFVRPLNEWMMARFDACWIPDLPGDHSLAGDLIAFGQLKSIKTEFIGCLSRFTPKKAVEKKYDVVAVFSGPEPQRTILENIIVPQLKTSSLNFLAVRGLPDSIVPQSDKRIVNFLRARELQECVEAANLIIARSGYSTVMDMNALGKKAVFIPTPGQTEQEYLAKRLKEKNIAFCMDQNSFDLDTAILQSKNFSGFRSLPENSYLRKVVAKFVSVEP